LFELGSVSVTSAPGTAAFCWSVTSPATELEDVACPKAVALRIKTKGNNAAAPVKEKRVRADGTLNLIDIPFTL
jgi:hypothetical protein